MDQCCSARCRLSASSVVVCNARGRSAAAGPGTAGQYGDAPLRRHLDIIVLVSFRRRAATLIMYAGRV